MSCAADDTFTGSLDVRDVSSNPATVTVNQSGSEPVVETVANNMNRFVTLWRFADDTYDFTIPLKDDDTLTYDFTVDWGDGSAISEVDSFDDSDKTHTYAVAGDYTITIIGTCQGFQNSIW